MVATQHVINVIHLTGIQGKDLLRGQHGAAGQEERDDKDATIQTKARSSRWNRDPHMTRSRRINEDISRNEVKTGTVSLLSDNMTQKIRRGRTESM